MQDWGLVLSISEPEPGPPTKNYSEVFGFSAISDVLGDEGSRNSYLHAMIEYIVLPLAVSASSSDQNELKCRTALGRLSTHFSGLTKRWTSGQEEEMEETPTSSPFERSHPSFVAALKKMTAHIRGLGAFADPSPTACQASLEDMSAVCIPSPSGDKTDPLELLLSCLQQSPFWQAKFDDWQRVMLTESSEADALEVASGVLRKALAEGTPSAAEGAIEVVAAVVQALPELPRLLINLRQGATRDLEKLIVDAITAAVTTLQEDTTMDEAANDSSKVLPV